MLQTQAVEPALLELLKKLMEIDLFSPYYLVGGTALALQLGHRKSIDIDLFGNHAIDELSFTNAIHNLGSAHIVRKSNNIIVYIINGIKVDFVNYTYDWIDDTQLIEGFRLASVKDIAAMKLNAIAGRGSRKDFYDLYELLNHFSLSSMLEFYLNKYPDGAKFMVLKSLTYFDDADREQDPELLISATWNGVKNRISQEIRKLMWEEWIIVQSSNRVIDFRGLPASSEKKVKVKAKKGER